MERAIALGGYDETEREVLTAELAFVLFRLGRTDEAGARARQALAYVRDPGRSAQLRWILGYVHLRQGRADDALDAVDQTLADNPVPTVWLARLHALRSLILANGWGEPEATTAAAERAIELGERVGDRFTVGHALSSLFCIHSAEREYTQALAVVDRALAELDDETLYFDLRTVLLDNRVFVLQNLDRLDEAELTLRTARELADQSDGGYLSRMHIAAGVQHYWVGRWDDALAELDAVVDDLPEATSFGLRPRWPLLLLHGVAALITGHRDDRASSAAHLRTGLGYGRTNVADRDNCDFLLAAEALTAERDGALPRALASFAPILDPAFGRTLLRHQWLPDIVRLALEVGDRSTADTAVRMCAAEADREVVPARATAALSRCRGLRDGDLTALVDAAEHYRAVGRTVERAQTLEDIAVLLAQNDAVEESRRTLTEAIELYARFGADWDIRRAETRARRYGVRRGIGGPRRRRTAAVSGWDSLTPTELRVAGLVAAGQSNPEIAAELFLSRRTVQTHVQHILRKLGAHSRVEIARQAVDQDATDQESV
jgi:DNA-binding CsgD family transcriptional regulator